ncbi:type II secretion system protein GspL [Vreelandella sp. EE22]
MAAIRSAAANGQRQWRESALRRWLHLWLGELAGVLPPAMAARFQRDDIQRLTWPLPEAIDTERPAVLVLGAGQVMAQRIPLPAAATRQLHRVLQYELDKYTPYPAQHVHFVARVVSKQAGQAQVELVAIARERLDEILTACHERGLHLTRLDAEDATGARRGIDLLPASARKGAKRSGSLNRWLWVSGLALCVAIASLYVHQQKQLVSRMQDEVANQREQVQRLQALREQLDATVGASRYLAKLKAERPTVSRLLVELTECLGDESWISQLEVQDGVNVTFSGQSPRASALIAQVQTCPSLEQVQFQGIIRPDDVTGFERFSIGARLKQGGLHARAD